jgi:hypothetical protein
MDFRNDDLRIRDGKDVLTISYDDLLKYHGHSMIGGVALAYKIMLWGLPKLTDEIPERGYFSFLSGIGKGGQGVIDATEMVMRVRSKGTLDLDLAKVQDKPAPATPGGKGRYYFELGYKDKILCLAVKSGVIPQDFYYYSELPGQHRLAGTEMSDEELAGLRRVRHELADAIMNNAPDDLLEVIEIKTKEGTQLNE